ncbi:hypothetical protein [Yinghuangia sp. YIM S10712]|uniref:hypothetical protein n=1 Tax=Yinghuangia sp. YIM S10712 TaxID=3436930 RepID=UPI003F52984D
MNPQPFRIAPDQLTRLAARFEATVPGLHAARDALTSASTDPDVAAGRAFCPGTWTAAASALAHAVAEVEHLRRGVGSTPQLLRACSDERADSDRLVADLLSSVGSTTDAVPPFTLCEFTPPPPPEAHRPPAIARPADPASPGQRLFRVPQFTAPAVEFAARVAGATPRPTGPAEDPPTPHSPPEPSRTPVDGTPRGVVVPPSPPGQPTAQGAPTGPTTGSAPPRTPTVAPPDAPARSSAPGAPSPSEGVLDARRVTILRRAERWAELGIGYSMAGTFEGYRTDCSGLVSMAWGLPAPGLTTDTLDRVAHRIARDDLLPGDVLVNPTPGADGHTLIFAGWADAERTRYHAYEQSSGEGAHFGTVPYPYRPGHGTFHPYRLDALLSERG